MFFILDEKLIRKFSFCNVNFYKYIFIGVIFYKLTECILKVVKEDCDLV